MGDFGWGRRHRSARMAGYMVSAAALTLVLGMPEIKAQTASARVYSINIPAKPLPKAIADLSAQTGLQVLYTGNRAFQHDSHAVNGRLAPEQALRQMLQGTGLNYQFVRPNAVTLVGPGQASTAAATVAGAIPLDTIDVQGANPNSTMTPMPEYAGGQVATGGQVGMLGNRSVMDTPFNQTSYTQKLIQNQHARHVGDVILNDPSVTTLHTPGVPYTDFNIRGFAGGAISANGLFGIFPSRSVESMERVEVLKGPSALLNGMSVAGYAGDSIGGSVNFVPKRAPDEPIAQLTNSYRSRSQFGTHLDVGRRFGENKEFGVRSNVAYRNGDGPFDPGKSEEGLATLGLDYRGDRARFSADLGYQSLKQDAVTWPFQDYLLTSVPEPPTPGRNSFPPWVYWHQKALFGTAHGEVDITDSVTAYAAVGANRTRDSYQYVGAALLNSGDWQGEAYRYNREQTTLAAQAGLRASVDTGPVHHDLSLNVSRMTEDLGMVGDWNTRFSFISNIYNPVYIPNPNLPDPGNPVKTSEASRSSVGIADTMSILDKRIQFTAGVRRQQVAAANFLTTGETESSYDAYAWSPAYALVVKPWENVSLYANYIEGLQQGTIVDVGYANAGEVFPPYQMKQYEAGVKVDWGRLTTTVSAFQIAQPNMITIPGSPLPTRALNGEQRNRGIEVNVFGELTEGVRLLGGVTLLDARLTKTQNGEYDGNKAPGVPDVNFVLGGEWDTPFLRGFTLTGRVNHLTRMFLSQDNVLTVPAWSRFDLGARYTFESPWNNKPIVIRFDVQNLFNKSYWITGGYQLEQALPRTYLLSTTFNF